MVKIKFGKVTKILKILCPWLSMVIQPSSFSYLIPHWSSSITATPGNETGATEPNTLMHIAVKSHDTATYGDKYFKHYVLKLEILSLET